MGIGASTEDWKRVGNSLMSAKRSPLLSILFLVALVVVAALLSIRGGQSVRLSDLEAAKSELEESLVGGESMSIRPAPGNQIQKLFLDERGRGFLSELDQAHDRLTVDPETEAYVCIWNGPDGKQVLFHDPGSNPGSGLVSGMYSQLKFTKVQIVKGDVTFWFTTSSTAEDSGEVAEFFGLKPGEDYQLTVEMAAINADDLIGVWRSATPLSGQSDTGSEPDREEDASPASEE